MALSALRPCAHPGCPALTRRTYCDKHRPKDSTRRSRAAADWHSWYALPIWRNKLRPEHLLLEPWCRECSRLAVRDGRPELGRVRATEVDHIKPHRGDWRLFTDASNLQSLCHACHSRKTAREMAEKREIF